MAKLWRCLNPDCHEGKPGEAPVFDFEADLPVCPKCGADGRKHPLRIAERACVHYLVNADDGPVKTPHGNRRVACLPAVKKLPPHCTGEVACVTCPACLGTLVVKAHAAAPVNQSVPIVGLPAEVPADLNASTPEAP